MRHLSSLFLMVLLCASLAVAESVPAAADAATPASVQEALQLVFAPTDSVAEAGQCSAQANRAGGAEAGLVATANSCPYEGSFCYNGGFTCMTACRNCNMGPGLCPLGFCVCFDT